MLVATARTINLPRTQQKKKDSLRFFKGINMNIAINELGGIIADFVRVGYNSAVADYDPPQDKLRLSEVKKWLNFRHIDLISFQNLVDVGAVHARKYGDAPNSPLYYSKAEIQKAFTTMRVNRLFVNKKINDYGKQGKED